MTRIHEDLQPQIDQRLAAQETPHVLPLRFGPCLLTLHTNAPVLVEKLRHYFQDFLGTHEADDDAAIPVFAIEQESPSLSLDFTIKTPDPGKTKIKEEYVNFDDGRIVRKRLTGMVFFFTDKSHLAVGPCVENDNQVINFLNNRFIEYLLHREGLLCHAAGLTIKGKGIGTAGFSGMGKSTLTLHLMNHDGTFVSNDRLIVRPMPGRAGLQMLGVPKLPRINPGTILHNPSLTPLMSEEERQRFAKLPKEELWKLEHKYDGYLDKCYGPGRFKLEAPLDIFVVLNWQRTEEPASLNKVQLRERPELLEAIMKGTGLFFRPPHDPYQPPSPEEYLSLFEHCDVYEASGGAHFDQAVEQLLALL